MSSFLELAKTRRSVRTFDGKGVSPEILNTLKEYSETIKNPYNIDIIFQFHDAKEDGLSSPVLAGEKCYVTAKVKKVPNAAEAYGYSFEALLMKAHELGLGTVWIGGTMPREKFEKAAKVAEDEIMPCVSPLGTVAKMSIKEGLMRKGVKADTRLKFEELFFNETFDKPLDSSTAESIGIKDALEAVVVAPSAVNKQPWRVVIDGTTAHFYEKKDKGFDNGVYDLQKVDVGIALYHYEQQLIFEGKTPFFEFNNPNISIPNGMEYIASIKY